MRTALPSDQMAAVILFKTATRVFHHGRVQQVYGVGDQGQGVDQIVQTAALNQGLKFAPAGRGRGGTDR